MKTPRTFVILPLLFTAGTKRSGCSRKFFWVSAASAPCALWELIPRQPTWTKATRRFWVLSGFAKLWKKRALLLKKRAKRFGLQIFLLPTRLFRRETSVLKFKWWKNISAHGRRFWVFHGKTSSVLAGYIRATSARLSVWQFLRLKWRPMPTASRNCTELFPAICGRESGPVFRLMKSRLGLLQTAYTQEHGFPAAWSIF